MADRLSGAQVSDALLTRPGWSGDEAGIERTVTAPSFLEAVRLVDDVADAAEAADHHPDIDIRWRSVRFVLSTHSAGGVTAKDLYLAETIDRLASARSAT
jgi:4a-hydroxytetrahydrobiopterin dehydratase